MISKILTKIGLTASPHNPCLYMGNPKSSETSQTYVEAVSFTAKPLYVGLYVNDFVYFSEDPEMEKRFKQELAKKRKVDFMGPVGWFLGTHFEWN